MGAPSSTYAKALSAACGAVRVNPKLAHWARVGEEAEALSEFQCSKPVLSWLRHLPVRRHDELVRELLDKADEWVNQGLNGDMLVTLYAAQRDAGLLDNLNPTRFAVHRAAFSLAVLQGSPTLAAPRYLGVLVKEQSGIEVSHTMIGRHLVKLVRDRLLLSYEPGTPGIRSRSGTIYFDLSAVTLESLDPEALVALSLTSNQILALDDYRKAAKRNVAQRSDAAHKLHAPRHAEAQAERQARIEATRAADEVDPTDLNRWLAVAPPR